jgi:hypothetical protein
MYSGKKNLIAIYRSETAPDDISTVGHQLGIGMFLDEVTCQLLAVSWEFEYSLMK